METNIRPAQDRDAEIMAALSHQLGFPATADDILKRMRRFRELPGHAIIVAECEGAVAGWLHIQVRGSLELAEYAEISGMVVDERRRGLGIGAELVRAAEAWVIRQGLTVLRVRSNVVRDRAHSFYQNLGFSLKKSQKVFSKDLPLRE